MTKSARLAEDDGTGDVPLDVVDQEVDVPTKGRGRRRQAAELKPPERAEMTNEAQLCSTFFRLFDKLEPGASAINPFTNRLITKPLLKEVRRTGGAVDKGKGHAYLEVSEYCRSVRTALRKQSRYIEDLARTIGVAVDVRREQARACPTDVATYLDELHHRLRRLCAEHIPVLDVPTAHLFADKIEELDTTRREIHAEMLRILFQDCELGDNGSAAGALPFLALDETDSGELDEESKCAGDKMPPSMRELMARPPKPFTKVHVLCVATTAQATEAFSAGLPLSNGYVVVSVYGRWVAFGKTDRDEDDKEVSPKDHTLRSLAVSGIQVVISTIVNVVTAISNAVHMAARSAVHDPLTLLGSLFVAALVIRGAAPLFLQGQAWLTEVKQDRTALNTGAEKAVNPMYAVFGVELSREQVEATITQLETEVRDNKVRVKQLEETAAKLREEREEWSSAFDVARTYVQNAHDRVSAMFKALAPSERKALEGGLARAEDLLAQAPVLRDAALPATAALEELSGAEKALLRRIDDLGTVLSRRAGALIEMDALNMRLSSERSKLQGDLAQSRRRSAAMQLELQGVRRWATELLDDAKRLQTDLADQTTQNKTQQTLIRQLQSTVRDFERDRYDNARVIRRLQSQGLNLLNQIKSERSELQRSQSLVHALQDYMSTSNRGIEGVNTALANMQDATGVDRIQGLTEVISRISDAEKDLNNQKSVLATMQGVESLTAPVTSLFGNLTSTFEDTRASVDGSIRGLQELQTELRGSQSVLKSSLVNNAMYVTSVANDLTAVKNALSESESTQLVGHLAGLGLNESLRKGIEERWENPSSLYSFASDFFSRATDRISDIDKVLLSATGSLWKTPEESIGLLDERGALLGQQSAMAYVQTLKGIEGMRATQMHVKESLADEVSYSPMAKDLLSATEEALTSATAIQGMFVDSEVASTVSALAQNVVRVSNDWNTIQSGNTSAIADLVLRGSAAPYAHLEGERILQESHKPMFGSILSMFGLSNVATSTDDPAELLTQLTEGIPPEAMKSQLVSSALRATADSKPEVRQAFLEWIMNTTDQMHPPQVFSSVQFAHDAKEEGRDVAVSRLAKELVAVRSELGLPLWEKLKDLDASKPEGPQPANTGLSNDMLQHLSDKFNPGQTSRKDEEEAILQHLSDQLNPGQTSRNDGGGGADDTNAGDGTLTTALSYATQLAGGFVVPFVASVFMAKGKAQHAPIPVGNQPGKTFHLPGNLGDVAEVFAAAAGQWEPV